MFLLEMQKQCIKGTLSSDLSHVELVSHLISDILAYDRVRDTTKPVLVTRELLKNAVVHGNRENPELEVAFSIERLPHSRYKITVKDAGEGFDHEHFTTRIPLDPRRERRMGYAIISNFSDTIEFHDNGASVTVYISVEDALVTNGEGG
jgi:anti-sigma regulatory factor (Ser/Thr protein kinase)